jgi:hypothetical protein
VNNITVKMGTSCLSAGNSYWDEYVSDTGFSIENFFVTAYVLPDHVWRTELKHALKASLF